MGVLNFGSLNIDYVYQVPHFVMPGETLSSQSLQVNCGGKGLNQSGALARAGVEVWPAGCIGPEGEFLRQMLQSSGVRTELVRQVPGSTGHAIIQVDRDGQNCILLYDGANGQITEEFADQVLSRFGKDDVLLLQNEISCLPYIMERAADRGMRIALNAAPANEKLLELPLEKLSWLLVNEVEGSFLAGQEDPDAIADILTERYPDTVLVLTLGVRGAVAARGRERVFVPARKVEAVDTTAAGDTFTGYFLRSAMEGSDLRQALELAAAASALAVTRKGAADSVPRYEEVLDFLQK